jgi:TonB family protein
MKRMGLFVLLMLPSGDIAQNLTTPRVIVDKLSSPKYPPLALQARIAGSVELDIAVRPDGSVESVILSAGHPILVPAAIESAKKTEFECKDCSKPMVYRVTYKFELGNVLTCDEIDANGVVYASANTQVSQSQDAIIVRGRPFTTCDAAGTISVRKFRSAKCLYLWRCAKRTD